jgi:hypothetical protein
MRRKPWCLLTKLKWWARTSCCISGLSFWKPHWPEGYDMIHSILTALSLSLELTPDIQQITLIVDRQFFIVVTNPTQKPMQSPRSLLESLSTHMTSILYCKPSNNSAQLYQNPISGACSSDLCTLQKLHRCLKLECRIWLSLAVYKDLMRALTFSGALVDGT